MNWILKTLGLGKGAIGAIQALIQRADALRRTVESISSADIRNGTIERKIAELQVEWNAFHDSLIAVRRALKL